MQYLISFFGHASLQLLVFPNSLLKRAWYHIKNDKVLKETFGHFSRRQRNNDLSFYNTFPSSFWKEEGELFELQKWKT